MRDEYIRQLRHTQDDLVRLGSRVEYAVAQALTALTDWDSVLAQQVVAADQAIDQAHSALEESTLHLLATQQPIVARDLRTINASVAIARELERIGDYAKGIARCVQRCLRAPLLLVPPSDLHRMANVSRQMLHTSMEALIRQDPAIARSLAGADEEVDLLEDLLIDELVRLAHADTRCIESAIALRDVAHILERLADRATNIAERVIFITTNQNELLNT